MNLVSSWATFWRPGYVTYRRCLLDQMLMAHATTLRGTVVDVGGKREHKRGAFVPAPADSWFYLNLEPRTRPHAIADAQRLPTASASADFVICTETIEHLPQPARCVGECLRTLKPGGTLLLSVPFLYPVHADPYDFQRFTADGLRVLLQGFNVVTISTMGGAWGVIGMFLESLAGRLHRRLLRGPLWRLGRFLQWLDTKLKHPLSEQFTTGYFVIAIK